MTAVLHALQNNENVPLARISERLVELAVTMAKIDLAPVLSDGDLHRLVVFRLERNR